MWGCSDDRLLAQGFATGVVHKQDRMGLGLGWLEQAVDAAAGSWNSSEPGLSSTTENIILLALFALLSLVLWRRRTLRTAQQRAPHVRRPCPLYQATQASDNAALSTLLRSDRHEAPARQCGKTAAIQSATWTVAECYACI